MSDAFQDAVEEHEAGSPGYHGHMQQEPGHAQRALRRSQEMVVRLVPLGSDEAADARVGGTVAERLALVGELSHRSWALTRQPLPSYTRATMPVKLTRLAEQ